jgi:hypothetical protein
MPTPEIMSMKMTADHKYRLPPVARGGRAAAWSVGLRGGVIRGPVGDLRN